MRNLVIMETTTHSNALQTPGYPLLLPFLSRRRITFDNLAIFPLLQYSPERCHAFRGDVDMCFRLDRVDIFEARTGIIKSYLYRIEALYLTYMLGCRIVLSFLNAFLANWNSAFLSLPPGCCAVESNTKSVSGVPSSFFVPLRISQMTWLSNEGVFVGPRERRSPIWKGNVTPVDCSAAVAIFRRMFMVGGGCRGVTEGTAWNEA